MFFSVYTLGCKLNSLETEAIVDAFCRGGFSLIRDDQKTSQKSPEPGIIVINTCTVTSMAEQKARRFIRKALGDYPEACIIVTGCYAQMEREALAALEEPSRRLFVIPGEEKHRLLELPDRIFGPGVLPGNLLPSELPRLIASWLGSPPGQEDGAFRFSPEGFTSRSRGFLKIQDGCDHRCAYCRVSLARGQSRSLGAALALERLQALEERGYGEAVLTGVNISQYRDADLGLPGLLDFLLRGTGRIRLRLSSIEPEGGSLGEAFAQVLAHPRIRPHFHLSLQSGSPGILAKMGRPYSPGDISEAVRLLRSIREDPFLACDIIAGFPGETELEFAKTRELCEDLRFAWIHAFPFSPRPGTAAFGFSGKVSQRETSKRVELLGDLARRGRGEYIRRWEGKVVEAILEGGGCGQEAPAVSENYLKLLVQSGKEPLPPPGSLIRCRILPGGALMKPGMDARGEII